MVESGCGLQVWEPLLLVGSKSQLLTMARRITRAIGDNSAADGRNAGSLRRE
jgi:hypothetical protein